VVAAQKSAKLKDKTQGGPGSTPARVKNIHPSEKRTTHESGIGAKICQASS